MAMGGAQASFWSVDRDYTQDSLHSVWFSVPNEYMEKYGELYALHATYLNAVLKPMLVTGNREIYSSVKERLGIEYPRHDQSGDFHYGFMSEFEARAGAGNVVHNYCKRIRSQETRTVE